jgi:hypothetical protein
MKFESRDDLPSGANRHFSQGIDLMEESGAKHAGRAINRLEIGLAMGSVSARRGSSQIEVGFEA